jgi:hypothetical protein
MIAAIIPQDWSDVIIKVVDNAFNKDLSFIMDEIDIT